MTPSKIKGFVLRAHAKINLHLDIGPRRADGYHTLQTLFQEISLHDTLRVFPVPRPTLSLEIMGGSNLLPTPDNLILRALHKLQVALRVRTGARVQLEKRIPIGAGLGGGSSDAAAALKAGWRLWKTGGRDINWKANPIPRTVFNAARTLGADVPFFLRGGSAWAEGIGEKLEPLPSPKQRPLVLIYPKVHVSTPAAYTLLDQLRARNPSFDAHSGRIAPFNSFEAVIVPRSAPIAAAKKFLVDAGCKGVMMSGSGSSVFGFADDKTRAAALARSAQSRGWNAWAVETV